jgi:flavorubredoxin
MYVVSGRRFSLLVDTGPPKDWREIEAQLDELIVHGRIAPVRYLVPTHPEVAHAGNLGRLLQKFPDAVAIGEMRDYHLVFPEFAGRMHAAPAGHELDLGGRRVRLMPAIFRDLGASIWAYELMEAVLFPGDGFSYTHYHGAGDCGKTAEELPDNPLEEFTAVYSDAAFYWTRYCDVEPVISELETLFAEVDIRVVAPAHGAPITDPATVLPKIAEGLRLGQQMDRAALGVRLLERR